MVLNPKKRTPKIQISEKWYRKKRLTLNKKLRQAIIDIMPFDTDKELADLILHTIFDSIVDSLHKLEPVNIIHFGTFYPSYHKARMRGLYWSPAHYRIVFDPCRSLFRSLDDKEPDGDSGHSQGA